MPKIFISYRRDDTSGYVGHLREKLSQAFGSDAIFRDIDTIEPGEDFVEAIQSAISSCQVLLAIIGKQWSTIQDANGQRRLNNPADFVRLEIAAALQRNIRVIPILVGGARMPSEAELPADLESILRRNAFEVTDRNFISDTESLVLAIARVLNITPNSSTRSSTLDTPSPSPKLGYGSIQVTLRNDWKAGKKMRVEIFMDQQSVGTVRFGASTTIPASAGNHGIYVRIIGVLTFTPNSGEVFINLNPNEEVFLEAEFSWLLGTLRLQRK